MRFWFAVGGLAAVAGGCAPTRSTRESRIPGERRDCRSAAALLKTGAPTAQTFTTLAWCDETGPAALAAVWRGPLPDRGTVGSFLSASANLRDARIFAAAVAAAADSSRVASERAAALLVVTAQLDSGLTVTLGARVGKEAWRAALARETHPRHVLGTEPLPADARLRVQTLIRAIATRRPTGATGLRDPLSAATQAAGVALRRLPP